MASSIEEKLELWRDCWNIDTNAYAHLCSILTESGFSIRQTPFSAFTSQVNLAFTGLGHDQIHRNTGILSPLNRDDRFPWQAKDIEPHTNKVINQFYGNSSSVADRNTLLPFVGQLVPQGSPHSTISSTDTDRKNQTESRLPCIRCWWKKTRCIPTISGLCDACSKFSMPSEICVRARFTEKTIFLKWQNSNYQSQLAWRNLCWTSDPKLVVLQHEDGGPKLTVWCSQFLVSSTEHILLYYRTVSGWSSMQSTAFALCHELDLDRYIRDYVLFYLRQSDISWLGHIFTQASNHFGDQLMWLALKLWAANRLLMKGWTICGQDELGMERVVDTGSTIFNTIPAPRVLQNQLDRQLESYIAMTEGGLLKELQLSMARRRSNRPWIVVFTATIITLHVIERDIWRLEYWVLNPGLSYSWRHPDTAFTLIQRSVHLSNLLLNHLRVSGDVPDEYSSIKEAFRGQPALKAASRYSWDNEGSIDFTLCSLAFDDSKEKFVKLAKDKDFGC